MKKRRLRPWVRITLACIELAMLIMITFAGIIYWMVGNNEQMENRYAAMSAEVYSHE